MTVQSLVSNFAAQIEALVHAQVESQVNAILAGALGKRRRGRPPKSASLVMAKPTRRAKPVTAKEAARRKIQGVYLGTIRHLIGANRAKVKAVAKKSGVAAAVAFAKKFKK